jgi:hypothetical protein
MADILSRTGATIFGLFLLVATTLSLLRTVVVPRSLRSVIADAVAFVIIGLASGIARIARTYHRRDSILAWAGPLIILGQLITWLFLYLIAYGLLIYSVGGANIGTSLRQSGSSLFTLGFASMNVENQTIIDFFAAATGPIVIALMIGFLPTIYSAYITRESAVTQLGSVAGEPAWGPELIARLSLAGNIDGIAAVFNEWARLSSWLRMTHLTYPVLIWVRSGRARRHYVVALLAVLDAAALVVSLKPSMRKSGAFAVLTLGGQSMQVMEVASVQRHRWRRMLPFQGRADSGPPDIRALEQGLPGWSRRVIAIEVASDIDAIHGMDAEAVDSLVQGEQRPALLTRQEFDQALEMLQKAGFEVDAGVDIDRAWDQFRVARSRYEFAAHALCRRLDAPRAPWTGDRKVETAVMWPTSAVAILPGIEGGPDSADESDDGGGTEDGA